MNLTTIRYGVTDALATITLNRPESRNALNRAMDEDLVAAAAAAAAEPELRLVLVPANGPVFCAGADLKERREMSNEEVRNRRLRGFAAYGALESLPMPVLAVVHGAAIGSGCEIGFVSLLRTAEPAVDRLLPGAMLPLLRRKKRQAQTRLRGNVEQPN